MTNENRSTVVHREDLLIGKSLRDEAEMIRPDQKTIPTFSKNCVSLFSRWKDKPKGSEYIGVKELAELMTFSDILRQVC